MRTGSPLADRQGRPDRLVGGTTGDKHEHLSFPVGEDIPAGGGRMAPQGLHQLYRRRRREVHLTSVGGADGICDLVGLGALQDVAHGSGLERGVDPVGGDKAGDRDHLYRRVCLLDGRYRGDSIHPGHHQVHDHDVRCPPLPGQPVDSVEGLLSTRRFADDVDVRDHLEERPHASADDCMVVDQIHTNRMVATIVIVPTVAYRQSPPPFGKGIKLAIGRW
jgi:hypothetical protein